jgi:hypothetical protein
MGTGKTLPAFEIIEASGAGHALWVGPKPALVSVKLEYEKWRCKFNIDCYTYESLKKLLAEWPAGKKAPQIVIFDESSRLKNPVAQRTIAASHLAAAVRREWGINGFVIEMSGSPAPKSPADWWSQCEIVQPGFLREGTIDKFKKRLAIIETRNSFEGGGAYPHLVTWRDDVNKCDLCGLYKDAETHSEGVDVFNSTLTNHVFKPSVNEIDYLNKRMNGLVMVKFKKDCFSGDTLVLTRQGPKSLKHLSSIGHAELYVMTDDGMQWIDCPIKSFGLKQTFQLTFGDHNKVRTTLYHEWLVREKGIIKQQKVFTFDIKESKTELPLAPIGLNPPDNTGYAHGFVFGDGTKKRNNPSDPEQCIVSLYGNDSDLKPLLLQFGTIGYLKREDGWEGYIDVVRNLPKEWKDLPINPTREYALGFVLGLVSADGCSAQHLRVYQADDYQLEKIRLMAIFAGLRVSPIRIARELSPFDGSYKPLHYFSIQTYNLKPDWILRKDHKAKMKVRGKSSSTTVTDIDYQSGREEEVFCAVVPRWHNFTLANGVVTGNCLDLPDKIYREIELTPSHSTLNSAMAIQALAPNAITAMTLLRELSDGFQYQSKVIGEEVCTLCKGDKEYNQPNYDQFAFSEAELMQGWYEDEDGQKQQIDTGFTMVTCPSCSGLGVTPKYERTATQVPTPKEAALQGLMEECDDVGRIVVYGGFTGSIDRISDIVIKMGWNLIRVDGRGWFCNIPGVTSPTEMIKIFQSGQEKYPRVGFVAQQGSAGMGLTLTASPMIVYYSNDFNAESRIQSEDRIHRPGMDVNRGATIVDLLHLPTDRKILTNLKKKKRLQDISMGELKAALMEAAPKGRIF